jgi:ketosteroid isomerase-like protein
MYHGIVRAKLRRAFANINRGNYVPVAAEFRGRHEHVFYGLHALAGTRRAFADTQRWYQRLARIFPDLRFEISTVAVRGWPWNTVATVVWVDRFTVNGAPDSNQGVHVFDIRWGRVTKLAVHCDTQKLADVLARKAEGGLAEAVAAPIETV